MANQFNILQTLERVYKASVNDFPDDPGYFFFDVKSGFWIWRFKGQVIEEISLETLLTKACKEIQEIKKSAGFKDIAIRLKANG